MLSHQIRGAFLDFFRRRGHEVIKSAPLVPKNDPTLMFTNAGMVQFKDVFVGKETRSYKRATSSQKCIRISGKHNDLENVGVTARHHTFFEMLGNFSFGDYFKEEAIASAWELLTKTFDLEPSRLVVSVFGGEKGVPADDEARAVWRKVTGFGDDRVVRLGMKDNFWQMGDTGPCGPCTEIHYFLGDGVDLARFGEEPRPDGSGWLEVWNLVFMQFDRSAEGTLSSLPAPCVDTGAGLERLACVLQRGASNYDTDILRALVDKASEIAGKSYRGTLGDDDVSMRVLADHARAVAFLVAEGIFPDRIGREYVLRRVMRRAIRHGHRLGIARPFLHEIAGEVVERMGGDYPELRERRDLILSLTLQEEVRFRETIDRGLAMLDTEIAGMRAQGTNRLSGETVFKLYDTYGFPLDLTEVIAHERALEVDTEGYERALASARERSVGSKLHDEAAVDAAWHEIRAKVGGGVRFTGYERDEDEGVVVAVVDRPGGEVAVVTDRTPFYGEAGGQVGDTGTITAPGLVVSVHNTQKPVPGLVVHHGVLASGRPAVGERVKLSVDAVRRDATRRNHSATHLLHWALRTVLGEQATQKGSLVGPERLRFDFSHGRAVTPQELARIEDLVNGKVLSNAPVVTQVLPIAEARKTGAMAIFEEKYGDVVRVLTMTHDSIELCGGTHARALGEIGLFKIESEGGVAAGVRRIEAVTGMNALVFTRGLEETVARVARALKTGGGDVVQKTEKLVQHERTLEREIAELKRKLAMGGGGAGDQLQRARDIPGGKALAVRVDASDAGTLREVAEKLRDKLGDAVVLVGAAGQEKAMLALVVSRGLTARYKAGELIRPIAKLVGGSGGGRPDMAQAGGPEVGKLDEALESLYARLVAL